MQSAMADDAATLPTAVAASAASSVMNFVKSYNNPAKPVLIVKFPEEITQGTTVFATETLEKILKRIKDPKTPVFIVSITGVFRSGKSFLLNLMKTYMDYYAEKGSDYKWEESDMKIEGGVWARGTDSVTHGIWMWDHHFMINGVAILLVDCQGTGDCKRSNPTLDNLILYLGLQLSKVQILNLKSNLQSTDLERLQLCADYANLNPDGAAIFDSLIFLVRDWQNDDYFGEKKNAFDQTLEEAVAVDVKSCGEGIKKAFNYITTFATPSPGKLVEKASELEKRLKITDVDSEFIAASKELFRKLFLGLTGEGHQKNGKTVLRQFKALKERTIELGKIVIQTPAQALEESLINIAYVKAMEHYNEEMGKARDFMCSSKDEIEEQLRTVVDQAIALFASDRSIQRYNEGRIMEKYLKMLDEKYRMVAERARFIFKEQQLAKRMDLLQAQKRELDAMKVEHEKAKRRATEREEIDREILTQVAKREEEVKSKQAQVVKQEAEQLKKTLIERSNLEQEKKEARNIIEKAAEDERISQLKIKDLEDTLKADRKKAEQEVKELEKFRENVVTDEERNVVNPEARWVEKEKSWWECNIL